MENGNEKENKAHDRTALQGNKQQDKWKIVCGADQRFYFTNVESHISQWFPPTDIWSSKLGLPYGWEVGINGNNIKYYINHVKKTTTLEDPRSEADQAAHLRMAAQRSRKVQIERDPSMGFGFVAGSEKPVVIRSVIPDGPSYNKLFANDQILRVNGEDVSDVPQELVINLIKSCVDVLEIHVVSSEDLQDTKNQGQRRSSLMSRATRERRRSSPVNVRFADDIVQYIGPAEQARRGSFPVIPNVLKVFLENGQTRSFHYNPRTIVQEIFTSLGQKLGIKSMEHFCLVLSGPQKNQLSFIQNHEKVAEVYLNRNCSRSSWVCKLRCCFLPRNPDELLEEDPIAFNYLYDQISKDIVEGLFEIDLRYDLAIKLAALHMQQRATASKKMPSKISVKAVEKDFDGLQHFIPENIVNGVKMKDLRKVLEHQIKYNQSLASLGQRYLTSNECKQQYLKVSSDLVSYGGKYFNVILYSYEWGNNGNGSNQSRKAKQQEATLLVSPRYGLSQMVKGKINVLCQLADLEQITEFSIAVHTEGKRLLTISVTDSKDILLLMKPLDSMDLVTFILGYQKLWKKAVAKLSIAGETHEPLAPLTDKDIPCYESIHRIIPDSWSYPSLLTVPGNSSEHNFFVDLSKDPFSMYEKPKDIEDKEDNKITAVKRSSEDIENENFSSVVVPEKKLKSDETVIDGAEAIPERDVDEKSRTLYMITEEGYSSSNNETGDEEMASNDYISQLALAEEMWREEKQQQPATRDEKYDETEENVRTLNNENYSRKDFDNNENFIKKEGDSEEQETKLAICDVNEISRNITDKEGLTKSNVTDSVDGLVDNNIDIRLDDSSVRNADLNLVELKRESNSPTNLIDDNKNEQFLDINDIDLDDRSDGPTSPRSSLADFSFAGNVLTLDSDSSTESQTVEHNAVYESTIIESKNEMKDQDTTCNGNENEYAPGISSETISDSTSEKKKYFSKKLNVDELELGGKVFNNKIFNENNSSNKDEVDSEISSLSSQSMDINNDDDTNNSCGDEETEVKLLSYTRTSDQFSQAGPDRDSSHNDDGDGVDAVEKDSDSSSITSRGSWNFIYRLKRTENQTVDIMNNDNRRDSSKKESVCRAELDKVAGPTKFEPTVTHGIHGKTADIKENDNGSSSDGISDDLTLNTDNSDRTVRLEIPTPDATESPKSIRKSPPVLTLLLGNEPGESEDAPLNAEEDSSELQMEMIDGKDFSLMEWVIPPPPDSTLELKDSDIAIASPPPPSQGHELISSPSVELKMFDELEIDSLVVPPPPLGSMDAVVKIVSPPPVQKRDSLKTYEPIFKPHDNMTSCVDINTKKLDNLSLSDGDDLGEIVTEEDRYRPKHLHSSESSGSPGYDFDSSDSTNYSDCMVSCYSLSNDVSQRTSDDEIFEDQSRNFFGEKRENQFEQRPALGSKEQKITGKLKQNNATQQREQRVETRGNGKDVSNDSNHQSLSEHSIKPKLGNSRYDHEREIDRVSNFKGLSSIRNESLHLPRDTNSNENQSISNGLSNNYDDYDCLDDVNVTSTNQNSSSLHSKFYMPKSYAKIPEIPKLNAEKKTSSRLNDDSAIDDRDSQEKKSEHTEDLGKTIDDKNSNASHLIMSNVNGSQNHSQKDFSLPSSLTDINDSTICKEITDKENDVSKDDFSRLDEIKKRATPNPTMNAILADASPEEESDKDSMSSIFPKYLLKESTTKSAPIKDNASEWSLEFETDSSIADFDERGSTHTRTAQRKTDDSSNYGTLDGLDKAEMTDINHINEDEVSSNKFHTAKLETKQLVDRLEVRIQGCVEDCKTAVLKSSYFPSSNNSKWKETVQENARCFTSDIKGLNTNVQQLNEDDVLSSIKSSQDTLQSLVSSFARASSTQSRISFYSIRILAGILHDVICLYDEVIGKTEEAVSSFPDKKKCKVVTEKTAAMNTLMASLNRTLKRV